MLTAGQACTSSILCTHYSIKATPIRFMVSCINNFFSKGPPQGPAFTPLEYIDAFTAIDVIKQAGGIPVLAHPGQADNFAAVAEWTDAGLEGIEVWHPDHNALHEQKALQKAKQYELIATGAQIFMAATEWIVQKSAPNRRELKL